MDGGLQQTREVLHRVAAHVLGRRRWEATGHFGLRASPGGIATPAFGEDVECVRIAGTFLVRESGGIARLMPIRDSSLRALATFAGADIDAPFTCGPDTPEVGHVDQPLDVSQDHADTIAQWYNLGWRVLDDVLSTMPDSVNPAALQLWPEHFDIGTSIDLSGGHGVNLGCSPGDRYEDEPYLYVGPWGAERPGSPDYWNAAFGAVLRSADLSSSGDPVGTAGQFMRAGLDALKKAAGHEYGE
jgi:hypothetical protein